MNTQYSRLKTRIKLTDFTTLLYPVSIGKHKNIIDMLNTVMVGLLPGTRNSQTKYLGKNNHFNAEWKFHTALEESEHTMI